MKKITTEEKAMVVRTVLDSVKEGTVSYLQALKMMTGICDLYIAGVEAIQKNDDLIKKVVDIWADNIMSAYNDTVEILESSEEFTKTKEDLVKKFSELSEQIEQSIK